MAEGCSGAARQAVARGLDTSVFQNCTADVSKTEHHRICL
jgi:hypothetical protein